MARSFNKSLLVLSLLGLALGQLCAPTDNAIFSTQINTPLSQNVVFTNAGSFAVSVSSVTFDGPDAALFVATVPTLPATVNQASTLSIPVSFQPTTSGLKEAVLILTNSLGAKTYVYLSGVAAAGLGGISEPSLQYILAANRIPVYVGDNDPSDNIIASTAALQNSALLGDEIAAQYFEKVNAYHPVSFDVLAAFGPTANDPVVTLGYYNPIGSASSTKTPILSVSNAPGNNGQTLNPKISGTPFFDPKESTFGLYTMWPYFQSRVVYSEDVLNTWDNGNHHLRVYQYKNEQGIVMNDTLILAWEEDTTNKDFNDIVLVARNIKVGSSMQLRNTGVPRDASGNLQPGYRNDLFTGFKINTGENLFILRRHFGNTFTITNQNPAAPLVISEMTLSVPADWGFYPAPVLPLTIAAGQSMDFNVTFIKSGGAKDLYESTLTITSDDAFSPTKTVLLQGLFMDYPEDINELSLKKLDQGFGFETNLDNPDLQMTIDGKYGSPLNGEEVRSRLWQAADSSIPVYARKSGSFRQCCNDSGIVSFNDAAGNVLVQMVDANVWSQTILPAAWGEVSPVTEMTYTPSGGFSLVVGLGGPWSSWSTNTYGPQQGVKTWPIRDKHSEIVPNMYLLGQDFIWDGCGNGGNCDYNDNFAHINNIKPTTQDGIDYRANDRSFFVPLGDASLVISWNRGYAAYTVKDSAGAATGFLGALPSGADSNLGQSAFQPAQLTVNAGALNVVAQPGSFYGTANSMVNALFVRFDGRDRPFTVSANMKNLGEINAGQEMAGIYLGSDKQYFATLTLTAAGSVAFYAEINNVGSVVGSVPVTAGMTNLRLMMIGDYRTNVITAKYEAYYAGSLSSGTVGTFTVPDASRGYFFGKPSEAGIYTSSLGGAPFTVSYDDFAVTPGTGCFYGELPTFVWGAFVPTAATPSSSVVPSTSASVTATNTASTPSSTEAGSTNTASTTGSNTPTTSTTPTETSPESCGESIPTQSTGGGSQSSRPTQDQSLPQQSTGQPTVVVPDRTSDAGVFAPMIVALMAALALTL